MYIRAIQFVKIDHTRGFTLSCENYTQFLEVEVEDKSLTIIKHTRTIVIARIGLPKPWIQRKLLEVSN